MQTCGLDTFDFLPAVLGYVWCPYRAGVGDYGSYECSVDVEFRFDWERALFVDQRVK